MPKHHRIFVSEQIHDNSVLNKSINCGRQAYKAGNKQFNIYSDQEIKKL